jgi:hypothetical protein
MQWVLLIVIMVNVIIKLMFSVYERVEILLLIFEYIDNTVKPVYNGHPWDLKNMAVRQRVV